MITFTVVTITYNAQQVVERTLNSVLKQSYSQVEHLIIDGASSDNTLSLVHAYQVKSIEKETGHQIRITSEPDDGLYYAMNKGILQATGDYIVFLNAGDCFPNEDTLETIAASVGEQELLPGVLYGETDIVDDQGHFIRHRRLVPPKRLTWRSFCKGMLVCHQAFYARTDLAKKHLYNTQYRYSADVDWCIRVMKESKREGLPLRNVQAVVVNYLDGGMSIKYHRASLKERFRVMCANYGLILTLFMHGYFVVRSLVKK